MCRRITAGFVWGIIAVLLCVSAGSSAGAATPAGNGTGSVSGRIFIDFNGNSTFDAFDVPLSTAAIDLFSGLETDEDGIYTIDGLPPGPYTVFLGQGPCADFLMNDWLGVYVLGFCPVQDLPDPEVVIVAGTTVTVDIPLPTFDGSANARLWLDGEAAPDGTPVSVLVDDGLCRAGEAEQTQSAAGVAISEFFIVVPSSAPECQGEMVSVEVDGEVLRTWTWNEFWLDEWVDWWYEGDYWSRHNVAEPPIFGVYGKVQGGIPAPRAEPAGNGGLLSLRAVVNGRLCSEPRPLNGDIVYGLIVVHEDTRAGCGSPGAEVTFCLDDALLDPSPDWFEAYGHSLVFSAAGESCPPLHTVDADCDGDADAVDALGILTLVAGLEPISDCWNPGDSDCDGDRDAVDALLVLRDVAGLAPGIPVGCQSFVLG